jgi:hypothetical protein
VHPPRSFHVFLTHDWGDKDELGRNNHDTVSRINEALKSRGLVTWFDSDRMARTPSLLASAAALSDI